MSHLVLNFHYVGMPKMAHPGIHGLTRDEFANYLEQLANVYSMVSPGDVLSALDSGGLPKGAAMVSFDDGLRCQYEVALPELERLGIPAAFFPLGCPYARRQAASVHKLHWLRASLGDTLVWKHVEAMNSVQLGGHHPSEVDSVMAQQHYRYDDEMTALLKFFLNHTMPESFTNRLTEELLPQTGMDEEAFVAHSYMNEDMLRELASRGWLGSHGMTHRPMRGMEKNALRAELMDSRKVLEELTGSGIQMVSYPLGNAQAVDRPVAEAAAAAGYVAGWTMERARNASLKDPLLFARMDAADDVLGQNTPVRSRYFSEFSEVAG